MHKLMSIFVIGDPHFKTANFRETEEMCLSIFSKINDINPDIIVILGDVLDRHEIIHVNPLCRANKFIIRLSELAPVYVLIGNHDLKNNRQFLSEEHPFSSLKLSTRITIVDKPIYTMVKEKKLIMVPYVPPGMFVEALNTLENWKDVDLIFAHQEFKGCKMGAVISEEGDEWSSEYPHVISGHIHNYQKLENVTYIGTPVQHGFDDSVDKTVSHLKFHQKTDGPISLNPLPFEETRIDLGCRKKKIVHLNVMDITNYNPDTSCDLRIYISGTPGENKSVMKHPTILEWKSKGINIKYKDLAVGGMKEKSEKSREVIPYLHMLYSGISSSAAALDWFHQLFGKIDTVS